jgi:hypothetical protein
MEKHLLSASRNVLECHFPRETLLYSVIIVPTQPPLGCEHDMRPIMSDTSLLTFVCGKCRLIGPKILECKMCKFHMCQMCVLK